MRPFIRTLLVVLFITSLEAKSTLDKGVLEKMIQPRISAETSYISDADIKGSSGGYSVNKNTISLNNAYFGLKYSNSRFEWNHISDLPFGDGASTPIEEIHTFDVSLKMPYKIDSKWFMVNSISAKSSFEDDIDGSFSFGIFSFASYKINKDHSIQIGAFASYHPIRTLVLPIVSYSYRAIQTDGFKFVLGFPRTYVGYHLNKSALLRLGVIYSSSVAKLSDDNVISKSGFIETINYMGNIGISYDINKNFKIQSDLLYGLQREFNVYDSHNDSLDDYDVKTSLGASLKIEYHF